MENIISLGKQIHRREITELDAVKLFRQVENKSAYLKQNRIASARKEADKEANFLSALRNQAALWRL